MWIPVNLLMVGRATFDADNFSITYCAEMSKESHTEKIPGNGIYFFVLDREFLNVSRFRLEETIELCGATLVSLELDVEEP